MYVCMECYEIYNGVALNRKDFEIYDEVKCPKLNCDGMVVELDELIAPAIIVLNQKGYMTEYCCSGHWYSKKLKPYIKFADKDNTPQTVPAGWEFENSCVIRYKLVQRDLNTAEQLHFVAEINQQLLHWALELPENPERIR